MVTLEKEALMRVFTTRKKIVCLKHFQFSFMSYQLLMHIQSQVPNLLLEIVPDLTPMTMHDLHQFIPAHELDLERFQALSLINA